MSVNDSAESAAEREPLDLMYLDGLLDNIDDAQNHLTGNDGIPPVPSFLPPNAVWTAREKDTFFHALSIYSRFRPDLISHDIKTKSIQDVTNYLSVLQLAASKQEAATPYLQWRQSLPIAMEVSPEWVAMEEEKSVDMIIREKDWRHELIKKERRAEVKQLKKISKTELAKMGTSQRKARLEQQIAGADFRARRKDFCGSLGSSELTAIGSILHEATDFFGLSQGIQQPLVDHTLTPQHSVTETLPPSATNAMDTQNLSQTSRRQHPVALLEGLSPASRRRYQKRLYMRRKRASIPGAMAFDDSLERLKPGPKKAERPPLPEGETRSDPEYIEDEGGAEMSSVTPKKYHRGKERATDELRDLGLTTDYLSVGVLNLEGVAKILNLWDKLSEDYSDYGSKISLETIQLLEAHVVWFVKSLIYRVIVLRERELDLKSETKVWKLSGKTVLAREHIENAISMTKFRELSKVRFFQNIITEMDGSAESKRASTHSGPYVESRSLHKDIYAPLVWVPELGDDEELADDTIDKEIDDELSEEEELDEFDMDIETNYELKLWDKVHRFQTLDRGTEASITKGRQQTTYKSAEFIGDSD